MAIDVGEIVATLKANTKDFEQGLGRSDKQLVALGASSVAVGTIAAEAFNHIAAAAINTVSAVSRWTTEAAASAEKVQLLSMKLGIGEKTIEGWGAALARVGLDQDALAGSMKTLAKHIDGLSAGSEKSVELFGKLNTGMDATELASVGTEKAIRLIADRFAGMSDGAEKARLAQELLGRAGLQLLPVLNQGSAGLDKAARDAERFGLVLNDTQRNSLLKYDDALDDLGLALEGFKKQVAAAFAPSLTRSIEFMTSAVSYAKSIWTAFADAAEKLFIRFGAIVATIELVGKQLFSLSVMNKEAWEQTLNQVSAIDKWAAAEIKAIDTGKNAEVQMEATTQKTKEYTVSQKALGEAIVAATQIQLKQTEAMGKQQERLGQGIVDTTKIQLKLRDDESKKFFKEQMDAEEELARASYLQGPDTNFKDSAERQEQHGRTIIEQYQVRQRLAQEEVDLLMAEENAFQKRFETEFAAEGKAQEELGKYIVAHEQAQQKLAFGWTDAMIIMRDSASFAFGNIRTQFANTVVGLMQGTATWKDFFNSVTGSILNAAIQMGINMVAAWAIKNVALISGELTAAGAIASIWGGITGAGAFIAAKGMQVIMWAADNVALLAGEAATALGVTSIWEAASGAILGVFGLMTAGIMTFLTGTIIPVFVAVGEAVTAFLGSIATALDISIFGAPFSVPVWAAVALVAGAIGVISAFAFGAFAEGGIVKGPMMGLVGEAGPEAIIPLSKMGDMMGGKEQTIIVQIGEREIARAAFQGMPSIMRVRGMSA